MNGLLNGSLIVLICVFLYFTYVSNWAGGPPPADGNPIVMRIRLLYRASFWCAGAAAALALFHIMATGMFGAGRVVTMVGAVLAGLLIVLACFLGLSLRRLMKVV